MNIKNYIKTNHANKYIKYNDVYIKDNIKSENERKANAAQAQSQWKKFTSFLGFTDKKRKIVHMQEVNTTDWSEEADWGEE